LEYFIGEKLILPNSLKRTQYCAHIYSAISYGIELYGCAKITHLQPLVYACNKVLRILQHMPRNTNADILYKNYKTLPVPLLYQYYLGILVYKCVKLPTSVPINIHTIFNTGFPTHSHNTRHVNSDPLFITATKSFYNSYSYKGCLLWN